MTDHPSQIKISDFAYELPEHRIAKYPLPNRGESKLLIYRKGNITSSHIADLPDVLPKGSAVYFNQSKVLKARLWFQKPTGGKVEIFCLEPGAQHADYAAAMNARGTAYWKCLVGGAAKWKSGQQLRLVIPVEDHGRQREVLLKAEKTGKEGEVFFITFHWDAQSDLNFGECLEQAGQLPIPPYLNRSSEALDLNRYQTVFARAEGSVAAPTAALHFTQAQIDTLRQYGYQVSFLTLHVGAGTFKPVKSERMESHAMHAEWIEVSRESIVHLLAQLKSRLPIIAVGTTVARTLESLYWIGCRLKSAEPEAGTYIHLPQWAPYEMEEQSGPGKEGAFVLDALERILKYLDKLGLDKLVAKTSIIIVPGYRFKILQGLLSNFHQPKSTLLLLISAWVGEDWRRIYDYALTKDYRFLSYGDACFMLP